MKGGIMQIVRSLVGVAAILAVAAGCASSELTQAPEVEGPLAKEGMAFSRIALSPVNIIGHAYAQVEHYGSVGVVLSPILIVAAVPGGTMATCSDILTGLAELLMFEQERNVKYPWQSFNYDDSERWAKTAMEFMDLAAGITEDAAKVANQVESIKHPKRPGNDEEPQSSDEGSDSSASGYGTISGPTILRPGATATYKLYVGGRLVNADWSQGGTSIRVYSSGDHGRVMAGTPPIRSGSFRTGVRAKYNGKTYSKTIYIRR